MRIVKRIVEDIKGPTDRLALLQPPLWSIVHDHVHAEIKECTIILRTRSCNSTSSSEDRRRNMSEDWMSVNAF